MSDILSGSRYFASGIPLRKNPTLSGMEETGRSDFGQRLWQARKHAKLTQTQLAKLANIKSQSTVAELERSGLGSAFTPALARVTGVSVDWLANGVGHMLPVENTSPISPRKRVPLISWVQAGSWSEVQDVFAAGEADEWESAYSSMPGESAFALLVKGDSMTSPYPGELTFPPGTIIIVDPGRGAGPNDFVLAKDVSTQGATFKKLVFDGGRWFLKPLNPTYPTIEIDDPAMRVIGRVIEYRNGGKL
jgi:SOS-response transcriptional repressor LexA